MASATSVPELSTLWLIRHGETDWTLTGQHTSVTDIGLTDAGRRQARGVHHALHGRQFQLVLVSPRRRAQDTCAIAGYASQAVIQPDLAEWHYGDLEGRTTAQIRQQFPHWSIWQGPIPNGETIQAVADRADRVIARCLAAHGPVAIFAHGHILRVLAACWLKLPPQAGRYFALDTASVSRLGWEHEAPVIQQWNETCNADD
jgi:broad specificity phosphatase PhoE